MQDTEKAPEKNDHNDTKQSAVTPSSKPVSSSQIVTADSVQSEEIPTIPLGSFQTVSALQPEIAVRSVAATKSIQLPAPLVAQPVEYRRSLGEWLQIWWEGVRPEYLSLALLPVLLGSVLAWISTMNTQSPFGRLHVLHLILTIAAVGALQCGANVVNDYYDYIKGVDTSNTLGPGDLIQQGLIKPGRVLITGLIMIGVGAVLGIVAIVAANPLVYLIGLLGVLCAYFFSATKHSLSSLYLGELAGFLIYGPLITLGAYFTQAGAISRADLAHLLVLSLPLGLLAAAIVHVNNMRDAESDGDASKYTPASVLGLRWSRILYILLLLGAYVIIIALAVPRHTPHLLLLVFWTLPLLAVALTGIIRADLPPSMHNVLHTTVRLYAYFAILMIVALFLTAFIPVVPHIPAHLLGK